MVRSIYLPLFLIDFDSQEGIENETEKKLLSSFMGFLQSPESAPPSFGPSSQVTPVMPALCSTTRTPAGQTTRAASAGSR